ncbi:YgjP-like metallopeptidase domain-containing protein [uncultured Parolsenella sp.]|uniref:M48 family metallopeptidase n=1 Tax=uncultured Parolsenella sp. TaxID=2083008 RepID=UPI0027D949E5|nr:YgjP-like metallopeptidase domain-containing protein [uncultured Parolsenella sp.]
MTQDTTSYQLVVGAGGASPLSVDVTRKRVRNLNLRVRRDGSVALSVPWRTSRARAQAFLDAHEAWIRSALGRRQRRQANDEQRTPSGTYPLWGNPHHTDTPLTPGELDGLYRREVARALPAVIGRMEALVGAHASRWQLRAMTSRWGSCTPGTGRIRINVRLAAYPPACLDYVVAHELAHLIEPSHNARFHAVVARAIPNEREVRALLRRDPSSLAALSACT